MLLNFTVSNWKSFKEKTSLSMIASKEKQHANHIQYLPEYKLNVLPIAVVFGANAAGKSNLVKAIDFAVTDGHIHLLSLLNVMKMECSVSNPPCRRKPVMRFREP